MVKPKCNHLQNVQLIFVSVQRTAQTSLRIFLQTRIMVPNSTVRTVAAIFERRLLKMAATRKLSYLRNKNEVASKIKHGVIT